MRARDLASLGMPDDQRIIILKEQADQLEKEVLENGWPKLSEVGSLGALSAWLVAQHSPSDQQQQQLFYDLMKKETPCLRPHPPI